MNAQDLTDQQLRELLPTLDGEALSDLLAQIDATDILSQTKPIDMAASASWYAAYLHWPVFPIITRGKRPLTAHGFKDASLDLEQIKAWWTRWPDANIGTPTGHDGCGLDVIDVDGRTGIATLARLKHALCPPDCSQEQFCAALGELPDIVARSFTPGTDDGPGRHLFIAATGDGNASGYEPGLDYRGDGGYVVLPPSIGMNGQRYSWITIPSPRGSSSLGQGGDAQ